MNSTTPIQSPAAAGTARSTENWPLTPAQDVTVEGENFRATSPEPWLRLGCGDSLAPGSIVRVRYRNHFFDDPVRPILRFWRDDGGHTDILLPAPYAGSGVWVGRVPNDRAEVWISPTNYVGLFDFQIESVELISRSFLLRKALASPRRMFYALSARLVGLHDEADLNLRWALGCEPMATYATWRVERGSTAPVAPRAPWSESPAIALVIAAEAATPGALDATCQSILDQSYPYWRVLLAPADAENVDLRFKAWLKDPRFSLFREESLQPASLIGFLRPGDILQTHALGCFVAHLERHPDQAIIYSDDVALAESGDEAPRFKPDWSPTLHALHAYVGRAALARREICDSKSFTGPGAQPNVFWRGLLTRTNPAKIGHVRRALFRFDENTLTDARATENKSIAVSVASAARITLIVPTRDRPDLLEPCLRSILEISSYRDFELLVVDNDSREPATLALFKRFSERYPQVHVIDRPGPFNFSAICNDAVSQAVGDFIVFLNNDTEIVTPDWIEKLHSFARRPDVGAVGARLLFPDGRVQHSGVVLGMAGVTGHFGAYAPSRGPGWQNGNRVPHEASAVTGACLMVEKAKFAAVGGFDSLRLPIDLNDIDLCLRLAERGGRTICDARVEIIHRQSASRGGAHFRLQRVYEQERSYFVERWRGAIRDDPYFNPALSLYAYSAELS